MYVGESISATNLKSLLLKFWLELSCSTKWVAYWSTYYACMYACVCVCIIQVFFKSRLKGFLLCLVQKAQILVSWHVSSVFCVHFECSSVREKIVTFSATRWAEEDNNWIRQSSWQREITVFCWKTIIQLDTRDMLQWISYDPAIKSVGKFIVAAW